MISLINILKEIINSQYAPLYHATSYVRFLSIINDELIKPNKFGYIFLTRDKNYKVRADATPIVFKIDQEKIKQRYKIFPRVGDISNQNKRIEAEEVVKGQIPLDWVIEIIIPKEIEERIKKSLISSQEGLIWAKNNFKNSKSEEEKKRILNGINSRKEEIDIFNKILNNPKLKII